MTDLQCVATAVLLDAAAAPPAWLTRLPVAAWFDLQDTQDLTDLLEETADRFRGETFVVTASADAVTRALHRQAVEGTAPVVLEIDSEGWHLAAIPDRT
ncbi:hypothetical protein [Arthrobacter agilis]|uniref:hypothetical protein n=1 Tax=Arthrobacter agilis TaxID=37921 RepID=UPI002784F717|nr:hypothetical protein [Arthrobacter agilis]MDQ0734954.1 hypothetical protein [Arthrobacter agilis]